MSNVKPAKEPSDDKKLDAEPNVSYGSMIPVSATFGRIMGLPMGLIAPRMLRDPFDVYTGVRRKPGINKNDTRALLYKKLFDKMREANPDELSTVHVALGGIGPLAAARRVLASKRLSTLAKTVGTPLSALMALQGAGMRSSMYDPFSDTVNLYSDNPAVLTHELGHAIDFNAKTPKWLLKSDSKKRGLIQRIKREVSAFPRTAYLAVGALNSRIPIIGPLVKNLYMEGAANTASLVNISEAFKDNPRALKHLKRMRTRSLFPAYSTYVTQTAVPYLPPVANALRALASVDQRLLMAVTPAVAAAVQIPSRIAAGESFDTSLGNFREAIGLDWEDSVAKHADKLKKDFERDKQKKKSSDDSESDSSIKEAGFNKCAYDAMSDYKPVRFPITKGEPTLDPKYKDFRYTPIATLGTGALFALVANIRARRAKKSFLKRLGATLNWGAAGLSLGYLGGQWADYVSRKRNIKKLINTFKPGKEESDSDAVNRLAQRYGWIIKPRWYDIRGINLDRVKAKLGIKPKVNADFNWTDKELSKAERARHWEEVAKRGIDDLRFDDWAKKLSAREGYDVTEGMDNIDAFRAIEEYGPGSRAHIADQILTDIGFDNINADKSYADWNSDMYVMQPAQENSALPFIQNERDR